MQGHHEVLDRVPRTKQVLGLEGGGGVAVDPDGGTGDAAVNPLVGGGGEGVEEDGPTPPIASGDKVVVRYLLLLLLLLLLSMNACRYSACLVFSQFRDEVEKRAKVYDMGIMLFCKKIKLPKNAATKDNKMALAVMTEAFKESAVLLRLQESDWIIVSRGFDLEPSHGAPGRSKDAHRPGSPYQKSWAARKLPSCQFQPTRVPKGVKKVGSTIETRHAFECGSSVHWRKKGAFSSALLLRSDLAMQIPHPPIRATSSARPPSLLSQ